jgi:hypothetical protein
MPRTTEGKGIRSPAPICRLDAGFVRVSRGFSSCRATGLELLVMLENWAAGNLAFMLNTNQNTHWVTLQGRMYI